MIEWLAVLGAALAASLVVPTPPQLSEPTTDVTPPATVGWMRRCRLLWAVVAGIGGAVFVAGRAAPLIGVAVAVGTWVVIGRMEPPDVRRAREDVRHDLPHVVDLFAATLRAGAAPGEGVTVVCAALPGPAADRLAGVSARLTLGVDPVRVWEALGDDPELAPLGRTLARAQATGASVVPCVERLAEDLARRARADVEERARTVGVKAAIPLGLCLLPAFILIGIVPLVAGLLATLTL